MTTIILMATAYLWLIGPVWLYLESKLPERERSPAYRALAVEWRAIYWASGAKALDTRIARHRRPLR